MVMTITRSFLTPLLSLPPSLPLTPEQPWLYVGQRAVSDGRGCVYADFLQLGAGFLQLGAGFHDSRIGCAVVGEQSGSAL